MNKISAQYVLAAGEKCGKLGISYILGKIRSKIDTK